MKKLEPRRRRRPGRWLAALALAGGLLVGAAAPAHAHPYLLRTQPTVGSVTAGGPTRIEIFFTEDLDRAYCRVTLVAPDGRTIATRPVGGAAADELIVAPSRPLTAQGTYTVDWTAVGDDGHTVIGSYPISVGHVTGGAAGAAGGSAAGGAAVTPGGPAGQAARILAPFLAVLLAGLLLLWPLIVEDTTAAGPTEPGRARGRARVTVRMAWAGLAAAVAVQMAVLSGSGATSLTGSTTGRHLLLDLALLAVSAWPVFAPAGRADGRPARVERALVALVLPFAVAISGHASAQPSSRRALVVSVYTVHLLAVTIWVGALAAVLAPVPWRGPDRAWDAASARATRLHRLVGASILAVVITGVADTAWGLRSIGQVDSTAYGRVVVLLALALVGLVTLGRLAGRGAFGRRASVGDTDVRPAASGGVARRSRGRLRVAEAGLVMAALVVAGWLGQLPQPVDLPPAAQAYGSTTGYQVQVTPVGSDLAIGSLTPGVPGANRVVVSVNEADADDFLHPVTNVATVGVSLECSCSKIHPRVALSRPAGSHDWAGTVDLPASGSWSLSLSVAGSSGKPISGFIGANVASRVLPGQVLIGVPADLSGPSGTECQNELIGLQVAADLLNQNDADHGNLVRIVPVDTEAGVGPALDRLHGMGVTALALPCGSPAHIQATRSAARRWGLPVITDLPVVSGPGEWSVAADPVAEGRLLAAQALRNDAGRIEVVAGRTTVDRDELSGVLSRLRTAKRASIKVSGLPTDPAAFVSGLAGSGVQELVLLADPSDALPLADALSRADLSTGWLPPSGVVASDQLMDTDFINDAGQITRVGAVEVASSIDPFDPAAQYYAVELRQLVPGIRPTFEGVAGYEAGLALGEALARSGGRPTPARLSRTLGTDFTRFAFGSSTLAWTVHGGQAATVAFFRSTYINPMAMPADTPGGAQALAHEGTFLDSGGFEQVAPFRSLS